MWSDVKKWIKWAVVGLLATVALILWSRRKQPKWAEAISDKMRSEADDFSTKAHELTVTEPVEPKVEEAKEKARDEVDDLYESAVKNMGRYSLDDDL